jgi:hypothetical protein
LGKACAGHHSGFMTLRSALQDLRETTLAAVSGLLAKLAYLGSLRRGGGVYEHWGLALVYGQEASNRALRTAHSEILSKVLRCPISKLEEDLHESSGAAQLSPAEYVASMQKQGPCLLPSPQDEAAASHLNSVLLALSKLQKNRKAATPSIS